MMRQQIINTAIQLTEQYGIKFTLDDIALCAHISKKTIYKYFSSKEELIGAVVDFVFADIHRQHQDILSQEISSLEKLRRIVSVYPKVIHFDSLKLNKLVELHPNIYRRIDEQFHSNWDLTLDLYDKCVKEGSIKKIDREYFRMILLGIFDQAIHLEQHEQVTNACIDAIFFGFVSNPQSGGG